MGIERTFDFCALVRDCVEKSLPRLDEMRGQRRQKPDGSWVTEGDIYVQEMVREALKDCGEDVVLVSEEDIPDSFDAEYVLTLDPIDGTANFTFGLAEWGVLVSVYRNMKHYQSMIFLPELGRCAVTGRLPERISGSDVCGLSSSVPPEEFAGLDKSMSYRMIGSCAVNMYYVLSGSYKSMKHFTGAYSWDIMAGLNLCLEAGLRVFVDGRPYGGEWLKPGVRYYFSIEG